MQDFGLTLGAFKCPASPPRGLVGGAGAHTLTWITESLHQHFVHHSCSSASQVGEWFSSRSSSSHTDRLRLCNRLSHVDAQQVRACTSVLVGGGKWRHVCSCTEWPQGGREKPAVSTQTGALLASIKSRLTNCILICKTIFKRNIICCFNP